MYENLQIELRGLPVTNDTDDTFKNCSDRQKKIRSIDKYEATSVDHDSFQKSYKNRYKIDTMIKAPPIRNRKSVSSNCQASNRSSSSLVFNGRDMKVISIKLPEKTSSYDTLCPIKFTHIISKTSIQMPFRSKSRSITLLLFHFLLVYNSITLTTGSLIIGDSAIEIQEVDGEARHRPNNIESSLDGPSNLVLGKANINDGDAGQQSGTILSQADSILSKSQPNRVSGPLPPLSAPSSLSSPIGVEVDENTSNNHAPPKVSDDESKSSNQDARTISGRVVDFELTPAGGHNKAKIKKKKKKQAKKEAAEEKKFKKWAKKKKAEKKSEEKKHMESMKKKKAEGKKGKKKWGHEEHGQKKKGNFKKKKWGKKVKKGKGVKKGKKGKKMLADKGHKNTGFKTVYHKEEWGGSKKWHDIKREKKWDEQSKKWKKKWKKEKGKKYKGDHMKKFEQKKKTGKKYKKEKKEKFKKEKHEEFKKGMKKKKEEHGKKKEGGAKKEMKEEKKKKKKEKKKKG